MASEATGTSVVVRAVVLVAARAALLWSSPSEPSTAEGPPGVTASLSGRRGALAAQPLSRILHRHAPLVGSGLEEEGALRLRRSHLDERC